MLRYGTLLFLISIFIFSSCNSIVDNEKENDFKTSRNLWQEQKIESYSFEFSKLCYCGGLFNPATIIVEADTIHAVLDPETAEPLRDPQTQELVLTKYPESFLTIDELFEVIENAREKADKLNVEYDQNLGYPIHIEIDYIKEAVDDEVTYKVNNFEAS